MNPRNRYPQAALCRSHFLKPGLIDGLYSFFKGLVPNRLVQYRRLDALLHHSGHVNLQLTNSFSLGQPSLFFAFPFPLSRFAFEVEYISDEKSNNSEYCGLKSAQAIKEIGPLHENPSATVLSGNWGEHGQYRALTWNDRSPRTRPDHEAVCYRARVSWLLPTPLLLFAGVVSLLPLTAIVRRSTSAPRLVAEAFLTTRAVIAVVWLAWVAFWLIEHRW